MRARSAVAVLAAILATGLTGAAAANAQPGRGGEPLAEALAAKARTGLAPGAMELKLSPRLHSAQGPVTAFLEMANKAPAVDVFTDQKRRGASKDKIKQEVRRAKEDTGRAVEAVVGKLRARDAGTRELYRTSNAVPGVVVTADAAKIRELAKSPEVRSVRTVVPKKSTNSNAVQLTKTVNAWQQSGKLGDGIRIGIIDDGLDYTHATFGGPGTKEAYQAIDRTKVNASYFPTAKVLGGIDLAGDDYDANGERGSRTPAPDPNPLSCGTHGTHVAGTAGGFGVNADGSAFTGDYASLSGDQLNAMRVGPGSAPKSLLYSIKVFGCHGSTDLTAQAMDWTLDPDGDGDFSDRLDVVNMSLGSDYGAPDDPDSLFIRKLVANGVLPVLSGGNGEDLYDIGGSPGNTPEALTVASVRDSYVLRDAVQVTAPGTVAGARAGQYSQDFASFDSLDLTKPVVALSDSSNKDGCQPFSAADKAAVAGKFAWLEWDDDSATRRCGSAGRSNNALQAGAAGAVFSSTVDQFGAGIAGIAQLPVFQFTATETAALRPALAAGTLALRMAGELKTSVQTWSPDISDTPSGFTSRGVHSKSVKPDVAAPGDTIASALSGSGNKSLVASGTSMAAPFTSGVAALVRQAHPDWTPEEVKAAVMNTAGTDVRTGPGGTVFGPNRVGSGRLDAKAALENQVLAMVADDPGAVSVSFGTVEVAGPTALTKTVKVINKGVKPVELRAEYQAATQMPGVRYELSTNTVKLSPRGIARVTVTLKIDDPKALRKTVDSTVATSQLDVARQFLADASGRLVLAPRNGSTVPLRVPVYAAPKPVADIAAPDRVRFQPENTQAVLNLSGRAVNQGSGSQAFRSLISVLELHGTSGQLPDCVGGQSTDCTVNDTAKAADLRYVGATTTAPLAREQGSPDDALVAFGIASWGNWANIGSNTVPFVDIDTTGDGRPDFESFVTKLAGTDVWVVNTVNLNKPRPGGGFTSVDLQPINGQFGDVDTNVFDTNVLVLPVSLKALGIDPTKDSAKLSYIVGVAGFYRAPGDTDGVIDEISTPMAFDPLKPAFWVQGGGDPALSYLARPGTALVVNRAADAAAADKVKNLLVLHHHNATDDKAQVIDVRVPQMGGTTPVGG